MSDPAAVDEQDEQDEQDTWADEEQPQEEPLHRRPRRKLLTPLTALLFAVLVGAGGFIAGVQVEKGEVSSTSSSTRGGGRLASLLGAAAGGSGAAGTSNATGGAVGGAAAGGAGRFLSGAGGAGGGATIGQVANISGSDLYVTTLEGNTIKVLADAAKITKQVSTSVHGVHPGDSVVVTGAKNSDGSIQASTVRVSGSAEGGGIGAFLGGGSGAGAGAASGAGAGGSGSGGRSGSGAGGGEPALFGK
jgi:hypothetical protein